MHIFYKSEIIVISKQRVVWNRCVNTWLKKTISVMPTLFNTLWSRQSPLEELQNEIEVRKLVQDKKKNNKEQERNNRKDLTGCDHIVDLA